MAFSSAGIPYGRLSAFYFFYYALLGGLAPFWTVYLKDQGFSATAIGQLMAVMMLTRVIAPNLWGWLGDVGHCRLAMVRVGSFLAFASFSGFLWLQGYWAYAVLMGLFSFFWTAVLPQFEVITLHNLGAERARYSQVRVWGSIGFICTVVGLGRLFESVELDWLPVCLLILLGLIWCASLAPMQEPKSEARMQGSNFFALLWQRPVLVFFLICFLLQLSHGPYYTFYSIYLQSEGYGLKQVGLLWSLGVIAEVVLFMYMHRFLRRYSLRAIIAFSLLLTTLRWIVISSFADSITLVAFAQILHAFSFGAMHAASIEFVHTRFHGAHQGQGQALYSSLGWGAGGACGAFLSGFLYDLGGGWLAFSAAAVAAAVALLCALMAFRPAQALERTAE